MSFNSSSIYEDMVFCSKTPFGYISNFSFTVTNVVLILPLCMLVLYLGKQQWRQRMKMTHSGVFTYHLVAMELLRVFGSVLLSFGTYMNHWLMTPGAYLFSINFIGQIIFQVLTCVDCYVAVVHPIAYLRLKTQHWIKVRNVSSICVWLLCFASLAVMTNEIAYIIFSLCCLCFAHFIIFYCNLAVLCIIIRPGPGEGGGDRKKANKSKKRAFYTITVITGTLCLRLGGSLISNFMYMFTISLNVECPLWNIEVWLALPSSLVLPLLFLHRSGKLLCWKTNTNSQSETD